MPISRAAWWRAATSFCLLVMAFAAAAGMSMYEQFTTQITHLQGKLLNTSQIKYIAVLQDAQQAPAMLVTFDLQDGALQIQRLNSVIEGREESMQLWALPAGGKTLRLPADEKTLTDVPELAISVESKGGADGNSAPLQPYLFKGAVVQKAL